MIISCHQSQQVSLKLILFGEIQFVNKEAIRLLKKDEKEVFRKSLLDNF